MGGDHEPCPLGRLGPLSLDDARERHVSDRAVAVPMLVSGFGRDPARLGASVEIGQSPQPLNPRDPVAETAAAIRILEVVGDRPRVGLREADLAELVVSADGTP
jgi:hypothetical protein